VQSWSRINRKHKRTVNDKPAPSQPGAGEYFGELAL